MSTDAFHAHLDVCKRCADNPFDLCPEGAALIAEAAKSISLAIDQRGNLYDAEKLAKAFDNCFLCDAGVPKREVRYVRPDPTKDEVIVVKGPLKKP